jgi:hypothetical protein
MIKTITIEDQNVKFDTALSWMFVYRTQFGRDPLELVMPAIKAAVPLFENAGQELTTADLDLLTDILAELNMTDGLQLIWALAKNADKDIAEPEVWYREFSQFPLDDVLEELIPVIAASCISTKKFKALSDAAKKAVPKKSQA